MLSRLRRKSNTGDPSHLSSKLIVGLGNPGSKYRDTRHNVGFMIIETLRGRLGSGETRERFRAAITEYRRDDERLVLLLPLTYMNDSGLAVSQAARWYQVAPTDILVVYDDMDLPFGRLRLRPDGSPGGHNGVSSIITHLGSQRFARLRVGIGRPAGRTSVGHVLSLFTPEERTVLPELTRVAAEAASVWLDDGIERAMNLYNRVDVARAQEPTVPAGPDPGVETPAGGSDR
jgi:PTH1 family peptidyl-tRNA hydrolase